MPSCHFRILSILAGTLLPFSPICAQEATPATSTSAATGEIVAAAKTFIGTLDETQRGKLVYDFKDDAQRKRWSNLPTTFVKRGGLRLGDLTPPQRDAAMAVVRVALSPSGYEKVHQIVEGDEYLKKNDHGGRGGPGGPGGRGGPGGPPGGTPGNGPAGGPPGAPGGGGAMFGHDEYYISFVGRPSATEPWMLQFGGHHLAINVTLVGAQGTLAPSHTAAQPAVYELEGKTVKPLGREADKGYALFSSLDEAQRKQAVLGVEIRDLVLGPGRDGETIQPEGIKGSSLTAQQRELLLDVASEWTGIQQETVAKAKLDEMRKNIADTWFAWSGSAEKGAPAYFRIQGPTVFIEYSPQRSAPAQHIHTIYRDPTNDYGAKWWKQ